MTQTFLTPELFNECASEAQRAPSVHNVQAARWRLSGHEILLLADPERRLKIGDPTGHDHRVGLGCAWEGMRLALSLRGFHFSEVQISSDPAETVIARGCVSKDAAAEPLAEIALKRASFRGKFRPATAEQLARLDTALRSEPALAGHHLITDSKDIRELAARADKASYEFVSQPSYFSELLNWMRLSGAHPDYNRDGLNADSLSLSALEKPIVGLVFKPRVFELLKKLGLAETLLAEKPKSESASAMLIATAPRDEDPFVSGQSFYRAWLHIASAGLHAVPISALTDSPTHNQALREKFNIPAERRLYNFLRIGVADRVYRSPRLPLSEVVS